MWKRPSVVLLPAACIVVLHIHQAGATTYNVVPDTGAVSPSDSEVYSLSDALEIARAGDTVVLGDGSYTDQVHSVASGEVGNPITITGTRNAVIKASADMVLINHSWITLEGFSVDGVTDDSEDYDSFTNKCVVVDGKAESEEDALQGFVMRDMLVQNCGGECVRLKNFVVNSEITGNEIYHCGVYDFEGDGEGVNGEGIYIGTSYNQWDDYGADKCNGNWVADNTIATFGNECVEVKEGSSYNIIEYNTCSNQKDPESGCFCSRGDENVFRYNDASDCEGAGIRLGGWEDADGHLHGQNNDVYDNTFVNTAAGAMAVRVVPQNKICGNSCEDGTCDILKDESEDEDTSDIEATWDVSCEGPPGTPSPVADTPAPVDTTPSPTSETSSPVISTPSPTEENPAPSTFTPSPEADTPAPDVVTPSPVMETPSPIGDTPSPVDETPSPVSQTSSPTPETPSPVFSTPSPVPMTPSPPRYTRSPISMIPSSTDYDTPSPVQETPSPVESTPSPTFETPSPSAAGTPSSVSLTPSPVDGDDDIEKDDDDENDDYMGDDAGDEGGGDDDDGNDDGGDDDDDTDDGDGDDDDDGGDDDGDDKDDDDDDNDDDGDEDGDNGDDYQSDDEDDDGDDDDGNDDYESDDDDDGNDDYESDGDDTKDDYQSDDGDDDGDDYQRRR